MFGGDDGGASSIASTSKQTRKQSRNIGDASEDGSSASEFYGFDQDDLADSDSDPLGSDEEGFDEDDGLGGFEDDVKAPNATEVPTVVFDDSRRSDDARRATKAEYKRFMVSMACPLRARISAK